jgi:hypothetical protein
MTFKISYFAVHNSATREFLGYFIGQHINSDTNFSVSKSNDNYYIKNTSKYSEQNRNIHVYKCMYVYINVCIPPVLHAEHSSTFDLGVNFSIID